MNNILCIFSLKAAKLAVNTSDMKPFISLLQQCVMLKGCCVHMHLINVWTLTFMMDSEGLCAAYEAELRGRRSRGSAALYWFGNVSDWKAQFSSSSSLHPLYMIAPPLLCEAQPLQPIQPMRDKMRSNSSYKHRSTARTKTTLIQKHQFSTQVNKSWLKKCHWKSLSNKST